TDTIRNDVPLTIAHRSGGGVVKNVGLQDVRIYQRALKAEEVAGISRNTRAAWLAAKNTDAITKEERDELYPAWLAILDVPFMKEAGAPARVAVNRFWQEIFGTGLVRTAGDFGVSGELPSHPELLDWLAVDFMEHNWDVKRLFKQIVMSATYRQAAIATPDKFEKDPANR